METRIAIPFAYTVDIIPSGKRKIRQEVCCERAVFDIPNMDEDHHVALSIKVPAEANDDLFVDVEIRRCGDDLYRTLTRGYDENQFVVTVNDVDASDLIHPEIFRGEMPVRLRDFVAGQEVTLPRGEVQRDGRKWVVDMISSRMDDLACMNGEIWFKVETPVLVCSFRREAEGMVLEQVSVVETQKYGHNAQEDVYRGLYGIGVIIGADQRDIYEALLKIVPTADDEVRLPVIERAEEGFLKETFAFEKCCLGLAADYLEKATYALKAQDDNYIRGWMEIRRNIRSETERLESRQQPDLSIVFDAVERHFVCTNSDRTPNWVMNLLTLGKVWEAAGRGPDLVADLRSSSFTP